MQTLNQDIKTGEFKQIYLLYGEEAFLKNSYKNRLKEAIIGDDTMNFDRFEGKGLDVDELIRLADTMPFFAERRLILVEDSGFFKSASDALVQYLPSMPDTTILLFVETEVDKRNRLYKKVKDIAENLAKIAEYDVKRIYTEKVKEIEAIVAANNYEDLLRICNLKAEISKGLADRKLDGNYIVKAIQQIQTNEELKATMRKKYFSLD